MDLENCLGIDINGGDEPYSIVGVLDDVKFNNIKNADIPVLLIPLPDVEWAYNMSVLCENISPSEASSLIENKIEEITGEKSEARFFDQNIKRMIKEEKTLFRMVTFFSAMAIFISCLGLYGMTQFNVSRKRKEISVRRINGASTFDILWLLNKNFLKPVCLAFILGLPVAYLVMSEWLSGYLQHIELSSSYFIFTLIITLLIAVFVTPIGSYKLNYSI